MERFDKIEYILEYITRITNGTWEFTIEKVEDGFNYSLFEVYFGMELKGEWLENIIDLKANCGEIESTINDVLEDYQ